MDADCFYCNHFIVRHLCRLKIKFKLNINLFIWLLGFEKKKEIFGMLQLTSNWECGTDTHAKKSSWKIFCLNFTETQLFITFTIIYILRTSFTCNKNILVTKIKDWHKLDKIGQKLCQTVGLTLQITFVVCT